MLEFYHRLALRLRPVRLLFWVLGAGGVAGLAVSLFGPEPWREEIYNVLAMTVLLWAVLGSSIVHGFAAPLPEAAAGAGRAQRFWIGVQRALLGLFALFVSGLALAVAFATLRAGGMLLQFMGS
ncbi:MAG: hypothetical protein JJT88_15895 [Gammaproteobacteria bacterium]|nr:hypothetical protein [Gammaproteobacteria bacterium]